MEQQPNYYSIIPANVRYDKRLKANEKLLFSEITALANKQGYCHAKNSYFADLYEVSKVTISTWINHLKECGYLKIKKEYKGKQIIGRTIIPINDPSKEKLNTPSKEKLNTYSKKLNGGIKENFKDNITSINNTSLNNIYSPAEPDKYAAERKKIVGYLNERLGTSYRPNAKKAKTHIDARLKEDYEFDDFKQVIDNKISDWLHDPHMFQYLRPETLFGPKFEGYLNEKRAPVPLTTYEERDGHFG